ncbi:MAG TPA: FkbM family methyltransferase [Opitutaceae bacterium]|nr:FkbM family methyltransferase [Opitutaceae bacterium]
MKEASAAPFRLPPLLRALRGIEFPHKLGICERLFARRLAREGVRWVPTAPGPIWKLDLANSTHRWIVYGDYEGPGFWRWLRGRAASVASVVDSGANIGQTVLYFAALLPRARILAYEPGQAARHWLEEGVARNRLAQVMVEPRGLGAALGRAGLAAVGEGSLHGSWNRIDAAGGEPIEIAPLDSELDRHGLGQLDLWKLDVEGYVSEALRGARGSLAAGRIGAIHLELDDSSDEGAALLRRHGYSGWDIQPSGRLAPLGAARRWGNALFLAPGHPSVPHP